MALTEIECEAFDKNPRYERRSTLTAQELDWANIPKPLRACRIAGVQDDDTRRSVSRYCKHVVAMVKSAFGMVLSGDPGVGKSGCAAIVAKEVLRRRMGAYWISHVEIKELQFEKNQQMFGSGVDGITIKQHLLDTDLVIFDGFNSPAMDDKAFGVRQLADLMIRRRDKGLASIMTTRIGTALETDEKFAEICEVMKSHMPGVPVLGKNLRDAEEAEIRRIVVGV